MPLRYFDRHNVEITSEDWRKKRADREYRTLGSDVVTYAGDRVLVSTQWIGVVIEHASGELAAWMYDTVLCTRHDETPHDGWNRRYSDLVSALSGHADVVDALRTGRWPA